MAGDNWSEEDLKNLLHSRPDLSELNKPEGATPQSTDETASSVVDSGYLQPPASPMSDAILKPPLKEREEQRENQGFYEFVEPRSHNLESREQITLFNWVKMMRPEYPELEHFISYPIGGKRHMSTAKRLKAEGAEPGFPDTFATISNGMYAGLGLEMKTRYNKPSERQVMWLNRLAEASWFCCVCWSWDSARIVVSWYFGIPMQQGFL